MPETIFKQFSAGQDRDFSCWEAGTGETIVAIVDSGIAAAVVGYTDALVASLLLTDRDTQQLTETNADDMARQLHMLENELGPLAGKR